MNHSETSKFSRAQPLARFVRWLWRYLMVVAFGISLPNARADNVTLIPDADATLIEAAPDNNLGCADWFTAGTTQGFTLNRGLMRFDITNGIPRSAKIISASMIVSITHRPSEQAPAARYTLHRMFRPWG